MADFTAHIGEGDEAPKFDKEEAEKYLKDKHIHKLMGTLLQSLVDSKPADPVDFLVESLTKMEAEESKAAAAAAADEFKAKQAAAQEQPVVVPSAVQVEHQVEPEPEPEPEA